MSWFTKLIGVDKVVQQQINELMKGKTIPSLVAMPKLLEYRSAEYKAWASSNPNNLLTFYQMTAEPTTHAERLMFWQWVGGRNVPKVHYPSSEIILNYIKGILFSGDVVVSAVSKTENETMAVEENKLMEERIKNALDDINFDDFCHNGSLYETYSGSLAVKFIIDKEVHDKPIIELYPKERFELKTKYGKISEYQFRDVYFHKDKMYELISYYGKGYVKYRLYQNNKEVPLSEITETKDLVDIEFTPNIILATFKKNRTVSNEFSELVYGGSDFEGITDIFHSIDEIFSTLMLYIRRSRPIMTVEETILPVAKDGSERVIPKEFEFDLIAVRPNDENKDKIFRSNPEIKTESYMTSIKDLMLSAYQKIGISYSTVDDSGIGANASGEAIAKRDKTTTIMRDSKIKLWIPFLIDTVKLYLMCEDFMTNNIILDDYKNWDWSVIFPEYNGQTFAEQVEELTSARRGGLIDIGTAIDKLFKETYNEEQRKKIIRNTKIENSIPLLEDDLEDES